MSGYLTLRRLAIMPTLKCTLRCKLCSNYMTMFDNPAHVPIEEIISDVDRTFDLIDYTEWLQFVGGEIFICRDLWKVYLHCLKYKDRFDKLILITNATVVPDGRDIDTLKAYGANCQVQISDYGEHSYKINENIDVFNSNNIPYVVKKYHGDVQHYGGWVDNTHFEDRGKDEEALRQQFENCGQVAMKNYHLYRGKLHGCARSLMASSLGKIVPADRDVVDVRDDTIPRENKRNKIRDFNETPRISCRSCISFGENSERFAAAEQL